MGLIGQLFSIIGTLILLLIKLAVFVISTLVYFLPTLVAVNKVHRFRKQIFLVNLLLGWSVIGWVAALIWSLSYQPEAI